MVLQIVIKLYEFLKSNMPNTLTLFLYHPEISKLEIEGT